MQIELNVLIIIYLGIIYCFLDEYKVLFAPRLGLASDLVRMYLQQSKANATSDTLSCHRNCIQMEKAANFALA